ncbi:MAG TPA: 4'-phosphopantetheinyl transferase superfamily protein [Spirochaetia bacterium]|nr:4'-phosphopantetheinyl transferase superfamily protein [Spirochaetia bacterium]
MVYIDEFLLNTGGTHYKSAVCFCYFSSATYYDGLIDCLHGEERQYFDTLGSQKRKKSYLIGRYSAKTAICRLTNENNFQNISIRQGIFNQPVNTCLFNHNTQVSITHSNDIGASIAFPEEVPMGIDVEMVDPETISVLASQATDHEKFILKDLPFPYLNMLTLLWTAKEALSKALKVGLMASYHTFEIEKMETQSSHITCHFKHMRQYKTISFNLNSYICSIAYPGQTDISFDTAAVQKVFHQA